MVLGWRFIGSWVLCVGFTGFGVQFCGCWVNSVSGKDRCTPVPNLCQPT